MYKPSINVSSEVGRTMCSRSGLSSMGRKLVSYNLSKGGEKIKKKVKKKVKKNIKKIWKRSKNQEMQTEVKIR